MSEPDLSLHSLPDARVETGRGGWSPVWLLPLVAALLAAWMVGRSWWQAGPEVVVSFASAAGVQPGKTPVKFKDVAVGQVGDVRLSEDLSRAEVRMELHDSLKGRINANSRFWIVRPRLGLSGISGLDTLISGAYIALDPGPQGPVVARLMGLEQPPEITSDHPGSKFHLVTRRLGSLAVGSPVYYRQIAVGRVISHRLSDDGELVYLKVFVDAPHDRVVRAGTRFWNASGMQLQVSSEGVRLDVESLAALIAGGVAFENSAAALDTERAAPEHEFVLHDTRKPTREEIAIVRLPYLLLFEDTVRGLSPGAPVEFRGIRVGTVTDISLDLNEDDLTIPVSIELEPDRVPMSEPRQWSDQHSRKAAIRDQVAELVAGGMRAQLKLGNLLTGQLFVDLDMFPASPRAQVVERRGIPVIPTVQSSLSGIANRANRLLARLEAFPLESIGRHLNQSLAQIDYLLHSEDATASLYHLNQALGRLNRILADAEQQLGPLLRNARQASGNLPALVDDGRGAMRQLQRTLASVEGLASEDGVLGRQALEALGEMTSAARSIRVMAQYLERHPEALLRGKDAR